MDPTLGGEQLPAEEEMSPDDFLGSEDDPYKDNIAHKPRYSRDMADAIYAASERWKKAVESNGVFRQARENFRMYHNAEPDGTSFGDRSFSVTGQNGEAIRVRFNDFRNLLTHILNMATTQKQAMQSKAANSEPDSLIAAQMFDGLLDYYVSQWKRSRSTKQLHRCKELSLFTPISWLLTEFDPSVGEAFVPSLSGQMLRKGDLYVKCRSFWDVWFDTNVEDEDELDWVIVRDYYNKFDLAERFSDKRDEILKLASKVERDQQYFWGWDDKTDLVPVYKFYHRSTASSPRGRMVWVCEDGVVLSDLDNPYTDNHGEAILPVIMMRSSDGLGTLFGHPPGNDLAPGQTAINMTVSGILTTEAAFGVPPLMTERGSDLSLTTLGDGLQEISYEQGKALPQLLQLNTNHQRSMDVLGMVSSTNEKLSGVNGAARGDPNAIAAGASGRLVGLLQSAAVQFQNGFGQACTQLEQDFGNMVLLIVQRFFQAEQITEIVGKDKVIRTATWTGDTFRPVARVVAEPVNPIAKTTAGAREEAEFMLQNNLISTPQEYLMVRNTGQLEPLFRADQAELNLIAQENEAMLKGEEAPVLITDRHEWHVPEHLALLASPSIRRNGAMVQNILAHVQEHRDLAAASAPPPVDAEGNPVQQEQNKPPQGGAQSQTQAPRQGEQSVTTPSGQELPLPDTATITPGMEGM